MITFKQFLLEAEAFNPDNFLEMQDKECKLFLGRMQPFHKGHAKIIDEHLLKNGFIAFVHGAKSDPVKNPLPLTAQIKLLKGFYKNLNSSDDNIFPKYIEVPSGYIPNIVNDIRLRGYEVVEVFAGDDRMSGYKGQIESFNKKEGIAGTNKMINVKFTPTERLTSATAVRNAVIDLTQIENSTEYNEKTFDGTLEKDFYSLMPIGASKIKIGDDDEVKESVYQFLKRYIKPPVTTQEPFKKKKEKNKITEDAEVVTTDSIETPEQPIEKKSKRILRRKRINGI